MKLFVRNTSIGVVRGSLLDQPVEVIVNAANRAMRGGGGIDGAIHAGAGRGLLEDPLGQGRSPLIVALQRLLVSHGCLRALRGEAARLGDPMPVLQRGCYTHDRFAVPRQNRPSGQLGVGRLLHALLLLHCRRARIDGNSRHPHDSGKDAGVFGILRLVLGVLTTLFGIGLLARVELVRGIMNVFCGIQILLGVLGLAQSLMGALIVGPLGLVMALMNVLQIATAAFMIYLIGETDRAAPNL